MHVQAPCTSDGYYIDKIERTGFFNDDDLVRVTKLFDIIKEKRISYTNELITLEGKDKYNKQQSIEELSAMLFDIHKMVNTKEFGFYLNATLSEEPGTIAESERILKINYDGSDAVLTHELTHAAQYMRGETDFVIILYKTDSIIEPGFLYDQTDEVKAFRRQLAFSQELILRKLFTGTQRDESVEIVQEKLDEIDSRYFMKITFMDSIVPGLVGKIGENNRVMDSPYDSLPSIYLSSKTPVAEIMRVNRRFPDNLQRMRKLGLKRRVNTGYKKYVKSVPDSALFFVQ
jgi:hypothetical protein